MNSVRVRMYRQGLGDCFLLTFPKDHGEAHVLIDCGVLTGTPDAGDRMRKVAQNILETTNGHLDALVVTHEHWDHISGFLQAEEIFNQLDVSEVWLAWTEDPDDDLANELRNRRARAQRAVAAAVKQLEGAANLTERRTAQRLSALLEFDGGLSVEGRKTTAKALAWVKDRKNAKLRYFKPGSGPFPIPGTEDTRVYVLGPPQNRRLLRKSDPSAKSSEVYELAGGNGADLGLLAALESLETGRQEQDQPFKGWFRIAETDTRNERFFADHYWEPNHDWRSIENDWLEAAGRLALQLDSDTNNTCLVVAFELTRSGRVLLFPGDAQVGNWLSWEDLQWTVRAGLEPTTVGASDLLARTVLYKVGHHGSHNATLREKGLELMTSHELAAMIPVRRLTAEKMEWQMPFPSLLRRLEQKTKGRILDLDNGVRKENPGVLSDPQWNAFLARTDVRSDWLDYLIEP
jgi:Metallo-beta-lactamase superfamily